MRYVVSEKNVLLKKEKVIIFNHIKVEVLKKKEKVIKLLKRALTNIDIMKYAEMDLMILYSFKILRNKQCHMSIQCGMTISIMQKRTGIKLAA